MSSAQEEVQRLREAIGKRWPEPGVVDSWMFLVTEVGEIGDALLRSGYGEHDYSRNHAKEPDVEKELGDTYLMLCTLATDLGVDLDKALMETITRLVEKHGYIVEP